MASHKNLFFLYFYLFLTAGDCWTCENPAAVMTKLGRCDCTQIRIDALASSFPIDAPKVQMHGSINKQTSKQTEQTNMMYRMSI